ncbi:MAG: chloride channel protein [Ktedonobacterales bacterium]|jgi:H+/Cl- antiporter ClcA/predicted transcriptional regulator
MQARANEEPAYPIAAPHRSSAGLWRRFIDSMNQDERDNSTGELSDFTTTPRVIFITALAVVIGAASAVISLLLLRAIGLFTNLFFFHRWDFSLVSPAGNSLGILEVLVPIGGGIIVGLLARYGSERIRGHGIPEAIEAILVNGSRVEPKVSVLKLVSSAISIGSGGPFGAEGPIIVTGGSFGSMIAQLFRLASVERKTLLVAGAAGGMSATFGSPVAAVMLAAEVLLFEWKPRSLMPVIAASATAAAVRYYIIAPPPIFPMQSSAAALGVGGYAGCILVGLLASGLAILMTEGIYLVEDTFRRLPIHWMWWPALGGLIVGIGGLIFPAALGVGYGSIASMLRGNITLQVILGFLFVKSIIWMISLGSGTSGGIIAPLLLIGGALGGLESFFLPNAGPGFWPLISMAAVLGSAMRAPLTGIIFAFELTHNTNAIIPLMFAVGTAHLVMVLALKRSILTEKVARRGFHVSNELAVDPLERMLVREVMRTNIVALPAHASMRELMRSLKGGKRQRGQSLLPVIDAQDHLAGVLTRADLQRLLQEANGNGSGGGAQISGKHTLDDYVNRDPVVAYLDDTLRVAVNRMTETGYTRLPVVDRHHPDKLMGMVALRDLMKARQRNLEEERRRERVLRIHIFIPGRGVRQVATRTLPEPDIQPEIPAETQPVVLPENAPAPVVEAATRAKAQAEVEATDEARAEAEAKAETKVKAEARAEAEAAAAQAATETAADGVSVAATEASAEDTREAASEAASGPGAQESLPTEKP